METIARILAVPGQAAYYYEDVTTLQEGALNDDEKWMTPSRVKGFHFVREVAPILSIGIVSSSGEISWGDCVGVSYGGKAGRGELFRVKRGLEEIPLLESLLLGKPLESFRELGSILDSCQLHLGVHYGVSQALLSAVAMASKVCMTNVVCREWDLPLPTQKVPIQGSSGNERRKNADKMIVNQLEALPHGQIDSIPTQLGERGEILLEYAQWLKERIQFLGRKEYNPTIHLDVHGAIGKIFHFNLPKVAEYLNVLERAVHPFPLRLESAILGESKEETLFFLKELRELLSSRRSQVKLVADEWANTKEDILEFAHSGSVDMIHVKMPDLGGVHHTIDSVLDLKALGVSCLLGGSCIETELSTKVSVHIALATQPNFFLAKPGMGIDEAIMLTRNEMARTLAAPHISLK